MSNSSRIVIATMLDARAEHAMVAYGYHAQLHATHLRYPTLMLPERIAYPGDIVRTRSVAVAWALERQDWAWLLFWDSDVFPEDVSIVGHMLGCAERGGHDWIAAPYPLKRDAEAYPFRPLDRSAPVQAHDGCAEVAGVGIGFTLIRRRALAKMVDAYRKEHWFTHQGREVVAIFQLMYTPVDANGEREMLSEDFSACERWRALGGKVQMYVGPGAPLAHVGLKAYRGTSLVEAPAAP